MSRDQSYGSLMLLISIVGLILYAWLLYSYAVVVLQITAFLAVALVLVLLGWIGWTMATTPPPAPITEALPTDPATTVSAAKNPE